MPQVDQLKRRGLQQNRFIATAMTLLRGTRALQSSQWEGRGIGLSWIVMGRNWSTQFRLVLHKPCVLMLIGLYRQTCLVYHHLVRQVFAGQARTIFLLVLGATCRIIYHTLVVGLTFLLEAT